jgi:signal transduction histidine kinase
VNEEWITFTNDGHRELVETIKAPLRNLDGELTGVLGIARDITQRKQNEELQRYAAFQSGVAEMGVSVLHNIGNAVTAMASDAEAVRQASEDIGRVSTLLEKSASDSVARQATGALADSELARLQAIQREAASAIVNLNTQGLLARSQRISESVQHISDIVRIQQSAALPSATASAFDLRQTVRNALSMQGDSLNQHGIHIEVEIDPALRLVTLSHNHLLQALVNVVKNAYEAIRQRQQQETLVGEISLRADVLDADWMRIAVTDNGIGFTPDKQDDLFRFGYSTKARGSGFGLHATALFVQELGGRISLESPGLNQGARLIMELPRRPLASNLAGATDARQVEKPE